MVEFLLIGAVEQHWRSDIKNTQRRLLFRAQPGLDQIFAGLALMAELEKYMPSLHNFLQCVENIVLNSVVMMLYVFFKNSYLYSCSLS